MEELGWDILNEHPLTIPIEGAPYVLRPLVEKRGVRVFVCEPDAEGRIPADGVLRKIEHEVIRYAYEHFIIYVDAAREHQVWQWVKREAGQAAGPAHASLSQRAVRRTAGAETGAAGYQTGRGRAPADDRGGRACGKSLRCRACHEEVL